MKYFSPKVLPHMCDLHDVINHTSLFLLCLFHKPICVHKKRDMPAVDCFTSEFFVSGLSHCTRTRKGFCCSCGSAKLILICLPLSSVKSPGGTKHRHARYVVDQYGITRLNRQVCSVLSARPAGHRLVCIFRRLLEKLKDHPPTLLFSTISDPSE